MDTTNELQQSLLDTMNLISSKLADSTNAPVTIKAEIVEQLDSGTRLYSIKYGGTVYKDAYAISSVTYEPSTMVFVLVPDNNFDNTKMILNAVIPSADEEADEELTDIRVPLGDNMVLSELDLDLNETNVIELKSWLNQEYTDILDQHPTDPPKITEKFNAVINDYLSKYRTLLFSAKIRTEIDIDYQSKGNYGLKLILPFVQIDTSKSGEESKVKVNKEFVMDVTNMLGNPYKYKAYQNVQLYFDIDDTLIYDTEGKAKIIPFTKDFGYISIPDKDADIYIRDISVEMVETIPAQETQGYYLTLTSSNGHYFLNDSMYSAENTKTLTPTLRVNGKKTNCSSYECYWFVEDSSVDVTHENYFRPGGIGWKCLNKRINEGTDDTGKKTFQYTTNIYSWEVNASDVVSKLRYKCLIMKKDISVSAIIELKNLNKPPQVSLTTDSGTNTYIENIGDVHLIAKVDNSNPIRDEVLYSTAWQLFDKDGNYKGNDFFSIEDEVLDPESKSYELHISFPVTEIEKIATVNCTFYQSYKKDLEDTELTTQTIGTDSIKLKTASDINYIVSIVGGDKLYKYDPEGDSPMEANYDGPVSSKLTACDPLTFKVFKADGKEFTEAEYSHCHFTWTFPNKDTMLVLKSPEADNKDEENPEYYYISGIGNTTNLEYKIRPTFKKEYTNNTIFLTLTIGDQETIETSTIMQFTKDGAGGTNGSKYAAIIEYNNYPYKVKDTNNQQRKFQAIYVQESMEGEDLDSGTWYGYEQDQFEEREDPDTHERYTVYLLKPLIDCFPFTVDIYSNEIQLNNTLETTYYTVDWSLFDAFESDPFFEIDNIKEGKETVGKLKERKDYSIWKHTDLSKPEEEDEKIRCNIIQATVRITGNTEEGDLAEEVLYAYYPIEMARVLPNAVEVEADGKVIMKGIIPSMEGGFEEILYASDGSNPDWQRGNDFHCVDSIYNNDAELEYEWSVSSNLVRADLTNRTAIDKISPRTKFEHNITNNYVKVDLNFTDEVEEKLNKEKDKLNQQIETKKEAIKDQNDLKDAVLEMVKVLSLNTYKTDYLDKCKILLQDRYQLLNTLTDLKTQLNNILAYAQRIETRRKKEIFTNEEIPNSANIENRIILLQKKEEFAEILDKNYKDVYLLKVDGSAKTDFNLKTLPDSMKINNNSTDRVYVNNSFTTKWNKTITDYNVLIAKYNTFIVSNEGKIERPLYSELISKIQKMPGLVPTNVGVTLFNTFNLLKVGVMALASTVTDYTNTVTSYTAFENLLYNIAFLVRTYSTNPKYNEEGELESTDYTDKIYGTKISALEKEKSEFKSKVEEIDRIFNLGTRLIYVKPILMHMNSAEMSYLRGWDGHKLYTDTKDGTDEYLFAPQLGAGKMEEGKFTGMMMGVRRFNNSSENHIGMFGYSGSLQTMFLNADDGSAIFGKSGSGQVIIDPSQNLGLLYSSTYFEDTGFDSSGKPLSYSSLGKSTKGMAICLGGIIKEPGKEPTTQPPYIHFGDLTGHIYSGGHNTIDKTNNGFFLNAEGLSIGSYFQAKNNGIRVGQEGSNSWKIVSNATTSYIGYNATSLSFGFENDKPKFEDGARDNSIYLGPEGFRVSKGFAVTKDGRFYGKNGYVEGKIYATEGRIGVEYDEEGNIKPNKGWIITKGSIEGAGEYKNGKKVNYIKMEPDGDMTVIPENSNWGDWRFKHDGTVTVDRAGSHFGGAYIADYTDGDTASKRSYFWSEMPTSLDENKGVFRENCQQEIGLISRLYLNQAPVYNSAGALIGYVYEVPSS